MDPSSPSSHCLVVTPVASRGRDLKIILTLFDCMEQITSFGGLLDLPLCRIPSKVAVVYGLSPRTR